MSDFGEEIATLPTKPMSISYIANYHDSGIDSNVQPDFENHCDV